MAETVTLEECSNGLAVITIERPKALNAANVKMVKELRDVIAKAKSSDTTKAVLLQGAGEKGFCSGGDVKGVCEVLKAEGDSSDIGREQLFQEYLAIYELKQLGKPVIALVHGITMGFGLGLSSMAGIRIATEKSRHAMPENNIGLFPDAGFPYLAANVLPPGMGRLMAVTGCHLIGAGDVMSANLATHYVPFEKFPGLIEGLRAAADISTKEALEGCVAPFAEEAPAPKLLAGEPPALAAFRDAKSLTEALDTLQGLSASDAWAKELYASVQKGAPFSQAVVWALLDLAVADAGAPEPDRLANALERDFAAGCRVIYRPDFREGVRAVLIDKDNSAKWAAATQAEVDAKEVEAAVAPLPESERHLGIGKY